jgi:hypothetical protein
MFVKKIASTASHTCKFSLSTRIFITLRSDDNQYLVRRSFSQARHSIALFTNVSLCKKRQNNKINNQLSGIVVVMLIILSFLKRNKLSQSKFKNQLLPADSLFTVMFWLPASLYVINALHMFLQHWLVKFSRFFTVQN